MYTEIHPLFHDTAAERTDCFSNQHKPSSEYYKSAEPQILRLDTIRRIVPESTDGSINLRRICISEDHLEDIIVTQEEADRIQKTILKGNPDSLSNNIQALTAAVRDLWQLLRARMR